MMKPALVLANLRLLVVAVVLFLPATLTLSLFVTPATTPDVVVRKQLDALLADDMYAAFKHASPKNKAAMGPLERFSAMVRSPPYDALVCHKRAELLLEMKASDTLWIGTVRVWSATKDTLPIDFLWQLSQVSDDGPFQNCWMVDGVFPVADRI